MNSRILAALGPLWLATCGTPEGSLESLNTRVVTLPDGARITCELMIRPEDMARGMMHRDQLAGGRGMLFVHANTGRYPYWMHNVRVPLDIIWLSQDRTIVEISENTPGCLQEAARCPNYGGNQDALYVLEMAGGGAARHGLKTGDEVKF